MVDYKYGNLFTKSHTDKQLKIIVTDFIGRGLPEEKYQASKGYEGKSYKNSENNDYYKCKKNGNIYSWEKITEETEYELLVFKNEDINWENFELTESLCSEEELRFGSCEASMVKFQILNAFIPVISKWITISETLEGNTEEPFFYGTYKVFSDVPTADREYRDITAYDAMYEILNKDVVAWYNSIFPNENTEVTMKQFRGSFADFFGLEEDDPLLEMDENGNPVYGLANDGIVIKKTIEITENSETSESEGTESIIGEALSGKDVITAICEINGCFGHIGRDGKLEYIYLMQDMQGLYPADFLYPNHVPEKWDYLTQADTGKLYPQSPKSASIGKGQYINCQYEDYLARQINKLQIRQEENDIGIIYGEGNNCYVLEGNFIVYGKETDELESIAENLYKKIKGIMYRPFSAECMGNPCLEVGDAVRLPTKYELVETYVLERVLKGIQAPRDTLSSKGTELYSDKVNGIQSSILQLKGKSNTLKRTVEETISHIDDVEEGMYSEIKQTADSITSTVSKNVKNYDTTGITIDLYGYGEPDRMLDEDGNLKYPPAEHSGGKYLDQSSGYVYTSDGKNWVKSDEPLPSILESAESKIEQTVKSIKLSVTNGEKTASLSIILDDGQSQTVITSDKIEMTGIVTFNNLKESGQTTINGANIITGTVSCDTLNGGEIIGQIFKGGGLTTIDGKELYNFEVSKTKTTVRDKFYISDTEGTEYLTFNATGDNAKLKIKNTALSLGSDIVLDPAKNLAVFSTPQKILIKGKGKSSGDWLSGYKLNYELSDGSEISAWDIGDAIQYISKALFQDLINEYDEGLNNKIDSRLRAHGLID